LVNFVEYRFEGRVRDAPTQDIERLHQWHARLQQCRQFLVENEEFLPADAAAPAARDAEYRQHAAALQREDEQTFVLELAAQMRFAVGDVNAFDDFAAGGAEPTTEFHSVRDKMAGQAEPALRH